MMKITTSEPSWCWCQDCKKWVPIQNMNYFDGMRVCDWCLEGTVQPSGFIEELRHEDTQCIYCDSYDTVEQNNMYKCNTCGETFRRF